MTQDVPTDGATDDAADDATDAPRRPSDATVDPARLLRIGDAEREQVALALRDAAGDGRLTMEELDERLEAAYGARTYADVAPLVADLPGVEGPRVPAVVAPTTASADALAGPGLPTPRRVTPAARQLPPVRAIGVLGGDERRGVWQVPDSVTAVAMWGGVDLDLREAVFTAPVTEITAVAVMGGIEITVPDDIVVEVVGIGVMGGFGRPKQSRFRTGLGPDAPVLRVKGVAFWGGVDVEVRAPRVWDGGRTTGELKRG